MPWPRTSKSDAVQANYGGIAAGRDIRDTTIHIGFDEQEVGQRIAEANRPLEVRLAALADQVARDKGILAAPLHAILAKLGDATIPEHEIPARLDAAADELIELRAQLARLRNDRPELAAIREQALALVDRGNLDQARAMLSGGRAAARALREAASRSEAELLADEARIDHLQLAYRAAAAKYAEAAALVAPFDRDGQWEFLMWQAGELDDQGSDFGDNGALVEAIGIYKRGLALFPRTSPLQWAMTHNNLGNLLLRLGARERGTALLEEAIAAYRTALKERTRERVPLLWAMTQNRLGDALRLLGEREGGTARLEEAIAAYRAALMERTRERVPLDWAKTQNSLGNALLTLGEREGGTARLEEAIAAYRAALMERTRERVPLLSATTQTSLGNALVRLNEREGGTARLEEAVAAYRAALPKETRVTLGQREGGTARLEDAVAAYSAALMERTHLRVPYDWAWTTGNLSVTLLVLAELLLDVRMARSTGSQVELAQAGA